MRQNKSENGGLPTKGQYHGLPVGVNPSNNTVGTRKSELHNKLRIKSDVREGDTDKGGGRHWTGEGKICRKLKKFKKQRPYREGRIT